MLSTATEVSPSESGRELEIKIHSLLDEYITTYQQLNQMTAASHTNTAKGLATQTLLLLRKDDKLTALIEESEEKHHVLEEAKACLSRHAHVIKSQLLSHLKHLHELANTAATAADLPYRVPCIELTPLVEVSTPSMIENATKDLLADLKTAEEEVHKTAEQFTAADLIKDELRTLGIPDAMPYSELLSIIWPDPKRCGEVTAGDRHPKLAEINELISNAVKRYRSSTDFKYRLLADLYTATMAIAQSKGTAINVSIERTDISPMELASEFHSPALDYGKLLLSTFFANSILTRRQERDCTDIATRYLELHTAEQRYWNGLAELACQILTLSHVLSENRSAEAIETVCDPILASSKHVLQFGRELKRCLSVCQAARYRLKQREEVMKANLDMVRTIKAPPSSARLISPKATSSTSFWPMR